MVLMSQSSLADRSRLLEFSSEQNKMVVNISDGKLKQADIKKRKLFLPLWQAVQVGFFFLMQTTEATYGQIKKIRYS